MNTSAEEQDRPRDIDGRKAFWLLADDRLSLGSDRRNEDQMRACLKHTLLFHPYIVISDSYAIKNYNFRSLIKKDDQVRKIIESQMVIVACRTSSDRRQSLHTVRDRTPLGEGPPEFTSEEYRSNLELDFLEAHAPKFKYDLAKVGMFYTQSTRDLFAGPRALAALDHNDNALRILNEVIAELSQGDGLLRLAQFHYGTGDVAKAFSARSGLDWAPIEPAVKRLARAHYVTALPTLLETDAVYARAHEEAFELSWKRPATREQEDQIHYQSPLGLHSFVKGISLLTIDDILALCDSDEGHAYEKTLTECSEDRELIKETLFSYQRRIEDRIITNHRGLTMNTQNAEWSLDISYAEQVSKDIFRSFMIASFAPILGGMLGILTRVPLQHAARKLAGIDHDANVRKTLSDKQRREHIETREDLISEWGGSERIKSEILAMDKQVEAVYSGIAGVI